MATLLPTKIRAPHGARELGIVWNDGSEMSIPHEVLRGYCPCAGCQGHSGKIEFQPDGNLELIDLATVGNYALQLTWGDRHASGLYSYTYLKALHGWHKEYGDQMSTELPELPRSIS